MESLFRSIAEFCRWGLTIYEWIILIAIVLSWVNPDPRNPIVQFLNNATRPFWNWIALRVPGSLANFSAYLSLLLIWFLKIFLPGSIVALGEFLGGSAGLFEFPVRVAGYFLLGAAVVLQNFLYFLVLLLGVWFVLTLVSPSVNNPIVRTVFILVDPFITPVQRRLPRTRIDLSPLVTGVVFLLINMFLVSELVGFSHGLTSYTYTERVIYRQEQNVQLFAAHRPCRAVFLLHERSARGCQEQFMVQHR
ncbi:MAG: YggT family protein [Candidatus Lambdaproteobacteria bacterium]|nr:YggT family protein [Candidatus Lambdaproteobacteria bacterium]